MAFLRSLCLLLLNLLVGLSSPAANWYAGTNGVPGNTGAFASPWDLRTALAKTNSIHPGDTLWLFSGIYSTNIPQGYVTNGNAGWTFKSYLIGTSVSPIYIRSYTNTAWARIDGGASLPQYGYQSCARPVFAVGDSQITNYGTFNVIRDIEFFSSSTESRVSGGNSDFPTDITRSDGVYLYGAGSFLVNCKLHDLTTGGSSWMPNIGGGFYGCEFWGNGWQGTPNAHGHNIYSQSRISAGGLLKTVARNLFSYPYKNNFQEYGSSTAEMAHYRNTQNGFIGTSDGAHGVVLIGTLSGGLANRLQDDQFTDNWTYGAGVEMYYHADPTAYADLIYTGNYLVDSYFHISSWQTGTFTNNWMIETTAGLAAVSLVTNTTYPPWNYNRNTYTLAAVGNQNWRVEGHAPVNFTNWKASTGYEAASTVGAVLPATNYVILLANVYDTNRANLLIYNWTLGTNVVVDLSGLGWPTNSAYSLSQSQDPLADIATGTTSSTSTINADMQAASHTVAVPYGAFAALGATTFPRYGQWALRRLGSTPAPPTTTYTLSAASSNPASGPVVSVTPADNFGASIGATPFTRTYNSGVRTTLTAPMTLVVSGGKLFEKWQFNGADFATTPAITITNTADITVTAFYTNAPAQPTTNVLTHGNRRRANRF